MADVDSEPEVPAEKDDDQVTEHSDSNAITAPKLITVLIICLLNLMNFIDRYSVPGNSLINYGFSIRKCVQIELNVMIFFKFCFAVQQLQGRLEPCEIRDHVVCKIKI